MSAIAWEHRDPLMSRSLAQIIAAQVERAIQDAGYRSQEEFAHVIGVPRATLHRVLTGTFDFRVSTLEKIAKGLKISVGQLLSKDGIEGKGKDADLHGRGPKRKSGIMVKILVPKGEDVPPWLIEACREGAGQIETEPAKRKPKTTGSSPRRSVGLKEILGKGEEK